MKYILSAIMLSLSAASGFAQSPPANSAPGTPAVATPSTTNPAAPIKGSNSFTESQAKARIFAAGYTDVSALTKDDQGVWRGKAMKAGNSVDVALDYQGNVAAK